MKFRDLLATLSKDGWVVKTQEGSHRKMIQPHEERKGNGRPLKTILDQAGLKK
jgi:predicted RNA binding protein YcfA (HicA-like mRNA interferase family)